MCTSGKLFNNIWQKLLHQDIFAVTKNTDKVHAKTDLNVMSWKVTNGKLYKFIKKKAQDFLLHPAIFVKFYILK